MIDAVDTGQQGTDLVAEQVTEQVTEQVQRLITAVGGREVSTREIMEMMGLQHRPTFLYDFLQPAINMGFVAMTYPDKPRSSKQRYRVTEKGRRWQERKFSYDVY